MSVSEISKGKSKVEPGKRLREWVGERAMNTRKEYVKQDFTTGFGWRESL